MVVHGATPRENAVIAYIVNGVTARFTKSVSPTGLALRPVFTTSVKSILTMMWYITKKRQTAMGMETTGAPLT